MAGSQRGDLFDPANEECVGGYHKPTSSHLEQGCERHFDVAISARIQDLQVHTERARCLLQVSRLRLCTGIGRVDEGGHDSLREISSWSNSSCFGPTSPLNAVTPVTLPPGRLRLATRPNCTGSKLVVKTTGIVVVAALAASADGTPPVAAMTLTPRRTRSAEG